MADLAADIIKRTEHMKSARATFNFAWQEVRDNVIPVLQRFVGEDPQGLKSNQYTVDETPEQAHELLAAAVHGMIANPALKYFDVATRKKSLMEREHVAAWLAHVRDTMFDYMYAPSTGLVAAHHETFLNLTSFGTGCLYTAERPGVGLHNASRALQEIYVSEGAESRVDTVHRWYKLSARAAAQDFGEKNLPEKLQRALEDPIEQDKMFEFVHAVYPRADGYKGALTGKKRPIASCHVSVDAKQLVKEDGFHEMPYAVPRWIKRNNEVYGRGPGMKALPSCKALQRAMKITLAGAEVRIFPPSMVADDGVLSPVRLHAKGLTYVRAEMLNARRGPIEPIQTGADPMLGEETMEKMRQRIQASFYNHLLQMMRDPRMTATQVIQIAEETLRTLGPIIGRLQAELLGPQIERTFWILFRAGAFLPPPPELHGEDLTIEYVSPVAQAQKLAEAKGIVQTFGVAAQLAQVNPEVMDNYDLDGSARALGIMFGMPRYLLRDPRAVVQMRADRQQKQDAATAMANLRTAASGIKDASSALPNLREGLGFSPDQVTGAPLAA